MVIVYPKDLPDDAKMPGSGVAVDRTNACIAVLVESMIDQGVRSISLRQASEVVIRVVDQVGTEDTADKYVRRIAKFGPFSIGRGRLYLHDEYRDGSILDSGGNGDVDG